MVFPWKKMEIWFSLEKAGIWFPVKNAEKWFSADLYFPLFWQSPEIYVGNTWISPKWGEMQIRENCYFECFMQCLCLLTYCLTSFMARLTNSSKAANERYFEKRCSLNLKTSHKWILKIWPNSWKAPAKVFSF